MRKREKHDAQSGHEGSFLSALGDARIACLLGCSLFHHAVLSFLAAWLFVQEFIFHALFSMRLYISLSGFGARTSAPFVILSIDCMLNFSTDLFMVRSIVFVYRSFLVFLFLVT